MNQGMGSRDQGIFACLRLLLGRRKRNPFSHFTYWFYKCFKWGRTRVFLFTLIEVHLTAYRPLLFACGGHEKFIKCL